MAKDKHTSSTLAYISVYSYANESVFLCVCVSGLTCVFVRVTFHSLEVRS